MLVIVLVVLGLLFCSSALQAWLLLQCGHMHSKPMELHARTQIYGQKPQYTSKLSNAISACDYLFGLHPSSWCEGCNLWTGDTSTGKWHMAWNTPFQLELPAKHQKILLSGISKDWNVIRPSKVVSDAHGTPAPRPMTGAFKFNGIRYSHSHSTSGTPTSKSATNYACNMHYCHHDDARVHPMLLLFNFPLMLLQTAYYVVTERNCTYPSDGALE